MLNKNINKIKDTLQYIDIYRVKIEIKIEKNRTNESFYCCCLLLRVNQPNKSGIIIYNLLGRNKTWTLWKIWKIFLFLYKKKIQKPANKITAANTRVSLTIY